MRNWLARWVVSALSLAIVANLGIGVRYDDVGSLVLATVVIGLANSIVRPLLGYLTMPLNCLTFGLFGYVLNFLLFYIVGHTVPGFHVETVMGAILGSILMGLIGVGLSALLTDKRS